MAQAKVLTERELKRALAVVVARRHADRDRLALLLTHWAGMRVCEVAALTRDKVLGPTGEVLEEWRLSSDQTKGDKGRVVFTNAKLKRELATYLKAHPSKDPKAPVIMSQKGRENGFSANTLCQLINTIYREAGIQGATSHSGRRGFITTLANGSVGFRGVARTYPIALNDLLRKNIEVFIDGIIIFHIISSRYA
jgi:integrase/recombinase XerD